MKIKILMIVSLIIVTGCASSATTQRLDELESNLEQVQTMASQALDIARGAATEAASAGARSSEVERTAQQALTLAEQASERALRIADECCGKK